jgi:hypothetical protein
MGRSLILTKIVFAIECLLPSVLKLVIFLPNQLWKGVILSTKKQQVKFLFTQFNLAITLNHK